MGWVDLVPRAGKLYIGGLSALYQTQLIREAGITHVVSVMNPTLLEGCRDLLQGYGSLVVPVEDDPNEDLLRYFGEFEGFVGGALDAGGAVFVHCAMGKSRSATLVVAYLMSSQRLSPGEALAQLCEGRPVCSPNPGFIEQLEVYRCMLQAGDEPERRNIYQTWLDGSVYLEGWEWESKAKL